MSKMTLLEIVQEVLSSLDSDEVNSIADTTESMQVAYVVKRAYDDLVPHANLPELFTLFELNAGSVSEPVKMTIPDSVANVLWVKYDKATTDDANVGYKPVQFMDLYSFLDMQLGLDTTQTNVETMTLTVDGSTLPFPYLNDKAPDWYTSYDDRTLIFDSFDEELETNLVKNKTLCYGEKNITFSLTDSYVPVLDERQFPLLVNEAKALAWAELKQTQHARAERSAKRGWINLQRSKEAVDHRPAIDRLPNYGRRRP